MKFWPSYIVVLLAVSFFAILWIDKSEYRNLTLSIHTRRGILCSANHPDFSGKDGLIVRDNFYDPKKISELNYGECVNDLDLMDIRKKMYSFLSKGDHVNYISCMKRSIDRLNPLSMCDLGLFYFNRSDRDLYQSEIFYLWSSAANSLGSGATLSNLGLLYEMGFGVDKNLTAAEMLYQNSSQLGEAAGYRNLAIFYELNKPHPTDSGKVRILYEKAAIMGDYFAQRKMLFERGK